MRVPRRDAGGGRETTILFGVALSENIVIFAVAKKGRGQATPVMLYKT